MWLRTRSPISLQPRNRSEVCPGVLEAFPDRPLKLLLHRPKPTSSILLTVRGKALRSESRPP